MLHPDSCSHQRGSTFSIPSAKNAEIDFSHKACVRSKIYDKGARIDSNRIKSASANLAWEKRNLALARSSCCLRESSCSSAARPESHHFVTLTYLRFSSWSTKPFANLWPATAEVGTEGGGAQCPCAATASPPSLHSVAPLRCFEDLLELLHLPAALFIALWLWCETPACASLLGTRRRRCTAVSCVYPPPGLFPALYFWVIFLYV
jgi:hypothetical protein